MVRITWSGVSCAALWIVNIIVIATFLYAYVPFEGDINTQSDKILQEIYNDVQLVYNHCVNAEEDKLSGSVGTAFPILNTENHTYYLTAYHVADCTGGRQLYLGEINSRFTSYNKVEVVAVDEDYDAAILVSRKTNNSLDVLYSLADSDTIRTGDEVAIIGYPKGESKNITTGKVLSPRGYQLLNMPMFNGFATNAPVFKGNSGGPVLRRTNKGYIHYEILGHIVMSSTEQINFAFKINDVKEMLNEISR